MGGGLTPERVFYDGSCALCHRAVRFVLLHDPHGAFRFAPREGELFRSRAEALGATGLPDSLVLETADGRLLVRSAAVIHVLRRLPPPWRVLGALAAVVPGRLCDALYDIVARVRYRLFGRSRSVCPLVPAELRSRFDLDAGTPRAAAGDPSGRA
jgi:predicted DCC family thiol-disulfide oxidoreductase YuxK